MLVVQAERTQMHDPRPLVFLDTSVVVEYLNGKIAWLFEPAALASVRYAINPIVLQETLLGANTAEHPERLDAVRARAEMLPVQFERAQGLLSRAHELRARGLHSNDVLVFSSAADCNYLVTRDMMIGKLGDGDKPVVLLPEEFHERMLAPALT